MEYLNVIHQDSARLAARKDEEEKKSKQLKIKSLVQSTLESVRNVGVKAEGDGNGNGNGGVEAPVQAPAVVEQRTTAPLVAATGPRDPRLMRARAMQQAAATNTTSVTTAPIIVAAPTQPSPPIASGSQFPLPAPTMKVVIYLLFWRRSVVEILKFSNSKNGLF